MFAGPLFDWRLLVANASLIEGNALEADEVVRRAAGVHIKTGPNAANETLPRIEDLEILELELKTTPFSYPERVPGVVHELLHAPQRVYPLSPARSGARVLSLAGAYEAEGHTFVAILTLELTGKPLRTHLQEAQLNLIDGDDDHALTAAFERFYLRTPENRRRPSRLSRRILLLTGQIERDLPPDWRTRFDAVGAVYGVMVETALRSPEREPAAVMLWRPRLGTPRVVTALGPLLSGYNPILIDAWHLDDALSGARRGLEPISDQFYLPPPSRRPKPSPGIRHYKKHFSTRQYDVMLPVGEHTQHDSWRRSGGEKARKGIERLEEGARVVWVEQCATCHAKSGTGQWRALIEISDVGPE
jgi:hypothetical protein